MSSSSQKVVRLPQSPTDIAIGTHLFRQEYLFAFAVQAEAANHVRTQAAEEDRQRILEIMRAWIDVQPRVQQLKSTEGGLPDRIQVLPVPQGLQSIVDELTVSELFQRQFQIPTLVAYVEADKMIAYQRQVNLEFVDRIMKKIGSKPSSEAVLRLCVSPQREMEPIQHLELGPAMHSFSSPNSDIRFLGAFLKDGLTMEDLRFAEHGGMPAAAIIAFVGYGVPQVNALKVGNRVILNNGFHRVVALRRLGVERIPLVLQLVSNPHLELPPRFGGLSSEYFVRDPRPSLVKDFFEPGFTVTLQVRERIKLVNLGVQTGEQEVPV